MVDNSGMKRHIVDFKNIPTHFPTHMHSAEFWEALGRAVATFGFLEEILGKAIFSFTATRRIPEDKLEEEYDKFLNTLKKALNDPLGGLIDSYGKAVCANNSATISYLDKLLKDLRAASNVRNVLCHGSWRDPDDQGMSTPFFINKKDEVFCTPIDIPYLQKVQQCTAKLALAVIDTVTLMGWQFPGLRGPGKPIIPT